VEIAGPPKWSPRGGLPLDGLLIARAQSGVHKFLVFSSVKEFTGTGGFLRFEVNEKGVVMCSEL